MLIDRDKVDVATDRMTNPLFAGKLNFSTFGNVTSKDPQRRCIADEEKSRISEIDDAEMKWRNVICHGFTGGRSPCGTLTHGEFGRSCGLWSQCGLCHLSPGNNAAHHHSDPRGLWRGSDSLLGCHSLGNVQDSTATAQPRIKSPAEPQASVGWQATLSNFNRTPIKHHSECSFEVVSVVCVHHSHLPPHFDGADLLPFMR